MGNKVVDCGMIRINVRHWGRRGLRKSTVTRSSQAQTYWAQTCKRQDALVTISVILNQPVFQTRLMRFSAHPIAAEPRSATIGIYLKLKKRSFTWTCSSIEDPAISVLNGELHRP